MVSGVPQAFPIMAESATASYNWVDIAEGTGIVEFVAGGMATDAGATYCLTTNDFMPAYGYNCDKGSTANHAYQTFADLDFDTAIFNRPKIIAGTLISQIPFSGRDSDASTSGTSYVTVNVCHVTAAGVETVIATDNSNELSYSDACPDRYFTFPIVVPLTHFKIGEKLRINVILYGKGSDDGTVAGMICFDPNNLAIPAADPAGTEEQKLTQSAGYTRMSFLVPFRIDL